MINLKKLLAVALVVVPAIVNADNAVRVTDSGYRPTVSVQGCCYVYYAGYWYCLPC
jgi:hypothetical protein